MTIEATYGVPTVALHTDKFDRVVRAVAAQNGMPGLRQAFVPQPVMGKTAAELRKFIDEKGMHCSSFGVSYDDFVNKTAEVAQRDVITSARSAGNCSESAR